MHRAALLLHFANMSCAAVAGGRSQTNVEGELRASSKEAEGFAGGVPQREPITAPDADPTIEALTHADEPMPSGPMSEPLACGLHNPMPGAYAAGYRADTGLDLAGMGQPVFAISAGHVDYAEAGHTAWTSPSDDDRAIRIELDAPIAAPSGSITHVWYAHLAELAFEQAEGAPARRRVAAGEYLGKSGRANGMYHLHMGLLIGGETSQAWGTYLLEDEVREVLCGLRHKSRLPSLATAAR